MPHKMNPIVSERICGLARLLRGNAMAAMENVALWHERDISHSSVERVIIPDSTITLYYMLYKCIDLVDTLIIYPEAMKKNLNLTNGLIFSQSVMLELTKRGVSREIAYRIVQRNAMKVWDDHVQFIDALLNDEELQKYLNADEIKSICRLEDRLKNIVHIYRKVGLES